MTHPRKVDLTFIRHGYRRFLSRAAERGCQSDGDINEKGRSPAPFFSCRDSSLLRLNSFGVGDEDAARVDDVAVEVGLRAEGAGLRDAVSPIALDHVVFTPCRAPGDV